MQEKEITHKGKRIFYRAIGEGPLVVFLHGLPFDGNLWINQFHSFSGNKLIIPDLPGSGKSEIIEDMSMEGLADSVKEIIVHETASLYFKAGEPGSVVMIGHSMGGYITLAFAEKYPELLNGFGLFHSTAYADSEEKKEIRKKGIDFIKKHGAYAFLETSFSNLFGPVTKAQNPGTIDRQLAALHNFSPEALVSYYNSMIERPDRTEVLKKTKMPVLFILGK